MVEGEILEKILVASTPLNNPNSLYFTPTIA